MAPLADDVEVYASEALPWGGTYNGRDGMMQFIQAITSHIDSVVVVEEMIEAGDHVIMVGRSKGTIKSSDEPYEVRLVDVVALRDGKIRKLHIFLDTPPVLEALAK
jgi:ketosteroid isomerase-like protein